jgi:hypothetical protein
LTTPSERFQRISDWIADLDSDNFQKRAKAIEQLELLGRLAEPALEKFLASRPPLDARRRAEAVLEKLNSGISVAPKLGKEAYNYEKFTSLFVEDFYFFPRKNDYYFVTASGKLFYAKALASGQKFRKMKELWTDAKRPIVAVIEDADRDKVFLFAKDKTAGAKQDLFFELNPTLRPQPFDRSKLAPVNVEGRARTLLEYLPLIRNEAKK